MNCISQYVETKPFIFSGAPTKIWPPGSSCYSMYLTDPPTFKVRVTLEPETCPISTDMPTYSFVEQQTRELWGNKGVKFGSVVQALQGAYNTFQNLNIKAVSFRARVFLDPGTTFWLGEAKLSE